MKNVIELLHNYLVLSNDDQASVEKVLSFIQSPSSLQSTIVEKIDVLKRVLTRDQYDAFILSDFYAQRLKFPFDKSELAQIIHYAQENDAPNWDLFSLKNINLSSPPFFINYLFIPIYKWLIEKEYTELISLLSNYNALFIEKRQSEQLKLFSEMNPNHTDESLNKQIQNIDQVITELNHKIKQHSSMINKILTDLDNDFFEFYAYSSNRINGIETDISDRTSDKLSFICKTLRNCDKDKANLQTLTDWLAAEKIKTYCNSYTWNQ